MKTQLAPEFLERYRLDPKLQHIPGVPVQAGHWFVTATVFKWWHMRLFSIISDDWNPLHYDRSWARRSRLGGPAVSGGILTGTFSGILAMHLPGPGTIYSFHATQYLQPARLSRAYVSLVKVAAVNKEAHFLEVECAVDEPNPIPGKGICTGSGDVVCDDVELVQSKLPDEERFFKDPRVRKLTRENERLNLLAERVMAENAALNERIRSLVSGANPREIRTTPIPSLSLSHHEP